MSEVYGEHHPAAFYYEDFHQHSTPQLEEWAEGIAPRNIGRPKRHWTDAEVVEEVNRRRENGHSERRACEIVAHLRRMDPGALRMRYRRALKR